MRELQFAKKVEEEEWQIREKEILKKIESGKYYSIKMRISEHNLKKEMFYIKILKTFPTVIINGTLLSDAGVRYLLCKKNGKTKVCQNTLLYFMAAFNRKPIEKEDVPDIVRIKMSLKVLDNRFDK